MNTRDYIIARISEKKKVTGRELSETLGLTRQALNIHLKELVRSGRVVKEGVTRGAWYRRASGKPKSAPVRSFKKTYPLKGLQEDRVYDEVALFAGLHGQTTKNVADIVHYVFTELLNNAIDHSRSGSGLVEFSLDPYACRFRIRDYGIGLFHSIAARFRLPDEHAAVGELLKGKVTTIPEKHTGEGIFFSSKAADTLSFRSHRVHLLFDNLKKDVFVSEKRFVKGTEVVFSISRQSKRQLENIFSEFAPERHGYQFEKTRVLVRLFQTDYISRSEARRLLAGLEKFKEIELDFNGVVTLGQGFADEVFRVFAKAHPEIVIHPLNLSPTLASMVRHVLDNNT